MAPPQRDPAVIGPAPTHMTAVVKSLWRRAEGAAVSGDADAVGRKWPLSALAPRNHVTPPSKHSETFDTRFGSRERARPQNQIIQLLIPMLGFLTNVPGGVPHVTRFWCFGWRHY